MANKVLLEVELTSKGIKVVEKQVKDTTDAINKNTAAQDTNTKSTNKATNSKNKYQRQEKGVGQITSNTTKAFSKQAQFINGGLVPAYATIAATVFAVGAAFRVLQNVARVEQLTAGISELGKASGLAMGTLAKGLKEATGNALSLEEAMRSTAMITSAGLDPSNIERFGQVAKDASIALGRDTADSLARLTRGVTKLEPELLDELGIMVRLDEATEAYAAKLGKSATTLTNFEKRQAFLNAVLEEGESKFGAIGDSVDTNPYDQLAAKFEDLYKTLLSVVSGPLDFLAGFLASSPTALTAAIIAFSASVLKQAVPALAQLRSTLSDYLEEQKATNAAEFRRITSLKGVSNAVKNYQAAVVAGTATDKMHQSAMKGSLLSYTLRAGKLKEQIKLSNIMQTALIGESGAMRTLSKSIMEQIVLTNQAAAARNLLVTSIYAERTARLDKLKILALEYIANGQMLKGMELFRRILVRGGKATAQFVKDAVGFKKVGAIFQGVFDIGKTAGSGFLGVVGKLLGPLALLTTAYSVLAPIFGYVIDLFKDPAVEIYEGKAEELNSTLKELKINLKEVDNSLIGNSKSIKTVTQRYTALDNVLDQFLSKYEEVEKAAPKGSFEEQQKSLDGLISSSKYLTAELAKRFVGATSVEEISDKLNITEEKAVELASSFIESQKGKTDSLRSLAEAAKESEKNITDFLNAGKIKTPYDEVLTSLNTVIAKVAEAREKGEDVNIGAAIAENLGTGGINLINVEKEKKAIEEADKAILESQKRFANAAKESGVEIQVDPFSGMILNAKEYDAAVSAIRAKEETFQKEQKALIDAQNSSIDAKLNKTVEILKKGAEANTTGKVELQNLKNQLAEQKKSSTLSAASLAARQEAEEKIVTQTSTNLKAERDVTELLLKQTDDLVLQANYSSRIAQLTAEIAQNELSIKSAGEKALEDAEREVKLTEFKMKGEKELLAMKNQALSISKSVLENEEENFALSLKRKNLKLGEGAVLKAQDEAAIVQTFLARRIEAAEQETNLKKEQIKIEKVITSAKLRAIKAEINLENEKRKKAGEPLVSVAEIDQAISMVDTNAANAIAALEETLRLTKERLNLEADSSFESRETNVEKLNSEIKLLDLAKERLSVEQQAFDSRKRLVEIEKELKTLENTDPLTGKVKSAREAAAIEKEARDKNLEIAISEAEVKKALIDSEFELLKARRALLEAEFMRDGGISAEERAVLAATDKVISATEQSSNIRKEVIDKELELLRKQNQFEDRKAIGAGIGGGSLGSSVLETMQAGIAQIQARREQIQKEADAKAAKGVPGAGDADYNPDAAVAGTLNPPNPEMDPEIAALKMETMKASFRSFGEEMKKLGPEGELISSVVSGAFTISDAFEDVSKTFAKTTDGMSRGAAVAEAAGRAIGAIGQIMAANSAAQIASIDKQIAAEKSRDGKSQESLAKISQLEKKKEQMQRKAFEQQKKVQMATVVANTAASIMGAVAPPPVGLGWPAGMGLAAMYAAMGAAQLAIIGSQSYQGGGGGAPSAPSAISVGERKSSVDLAKSKSAGGELAYFRGERGTGGPEQFTPGGAFMGAKYRAMGGPTAGYVVGEQGPELFVPQVPGTIMPEGSTPAAAPSNVNFSITALDASGVEDILVKQRGNIIGMMREAANSYGRDFMEEVDTSIYTQSAGGATRY